MTEFSMLPWETKTGTGDGQFAYNQEQANNFFRYFDIVDTTTEGVGYGIMNELEVTLFIGGVVRIESGIGYCYGRYWSDAQVNFSPTLPVAPTGGRVILEADWTTNTIRLNVILNTDGTSTPPALTQTFGTLWQISLYSFTVDNTGTFTNEVDERTFLKGSTQDGVEFLEAQVGTGAGPTFFSFTGIKQQFRHLQIKGYVEPHDTIAIILNGDVTANQDWSVVEFDGVAGTTTYNGAAGAVAMTINPAVSLNSGFQFDVTIHNYTSAAAQKMLHGNGIVFRVAGAVSYSIGATNSNVTTSVISMRVQFGAAPSANTYIELYGVS